jgi:hypothetical protein
VNERRGRMMAVYVQKRGGAGRAESFNMRNDTAQEKKKKHKGSITGWRERREVWKERKE